MSKIELLFLEEINMYLEALNPNKILPLASDASFFQSPCKISLAAAGIILIAGSLVASYALYPRLGYVAFAYLGAGHLIGVALIILACRRTNSQMPSTPPTGNQKGLETKITSTTSPLGMKSDINASDNTSEPMSTKLIRAAQAKVSSFSFYRMELYTEEYLVYSLEGERQILEELFEQVNGKHRVVRVDKELPFYNLWTKIPLITSCFNDT